MGLIRDMKNEVEAYAFQSKIAHYLSPQAWYRVHKHRSQRADRGWSDRDAWGAGDYIAKKTAEMLQRLQDESYTDWPEWFKSNVAETGKHAYNNLQDVIDDINNYLKFQETSWAEDLHTKNGDYRIWVDKNGKELSKEKLNKLIIKHHKEGMRLYRKAQKAMQFFGRHFTQFWD